MKYVNVNFPDDFLRRLDEYCEKHRMKRNAVLMLAMDRLEAPEVKPKLDWSPDDLLETPTAEDLIESGRLKLAPQPGERRIDYDDGRKR